MEERITLDYGSGGKKTAELIDKLIVPAFDNVALSALSDGAVVDGAPKLVFSADSFVVSPCFFPGGDVGKLAVCGTVNDLCMCGAEPRYLSFSLIIEEGFVMKDLERVIASAALAAKQSGVKIVTGDTKVVERNRGDGVYCNTAGIGFQRDVSLSPDRLCEGDAVIVSGPIGEHGVAVMLGRIGMGGSVLSDCRPLTDMTAAIIEAASDGLKLMRDPTRGGVATTLCEFVEKNGMTIELVEEDIPVSPAVRGACDLLGLDPFYCACEGRMLAVVSNDRAEKALYAMRKCPEGEGAHIIGRVTRSRPGKLLLKTILGGTRILTKLAGAQLPRIC